MKKFLTILILVFSPQTPSQADDISDLQIEGMSVGDSLLDYFSEEHIKNDKTKYNYPKSNKFTLWTPRNKSYKVYDAVQFHFKTSDAKYIIYAIDGQIHYFKDIKKCYPKKKEIYNEIKEIFPNVEVLNTKAKHPLDNKTKVDQTLFTLKQGYIALECYDWSKKMEKKYGDKLSLSISTTEFMNWATHDAY